MTGLEKQPNSQESRQRDYRNIITELEMKIILVFLIFHENKITVLLYFMPESSQTHTMGQQRRLPTTTTEYKYYCEAS